MGIFSCGILFGLLLIREYVEFCGVHDQMKTVMVAMVMVASVVSFAEEPVRVKVMTFNIYHGETMKGDFDLDRIAAVILKADPDVVALQEVDFKTARARGYDLATELGQRTKMAPLFGRAMPYDGGEYGEGILSKYSFVSTRVVALPHGEKREPRAALEAVIELPSGDRISVVGTHLDHLRDEGDRIAQARAIVEAFSGNALPTLLAGDLNAQPDSETIGLLSEHWTVADGDELAPTYPSKEPRVKIDYVMYAPAARWNVVETRVIEDAVASDHCALMATLELLPE